MKSAHESLQCLSHPRSIAIVGASRNSEKIGNKVLRNLILGGFKGNIYPVNPNATELYNLKCYPSVKSIDGDIELVWIRVCIRDLLGIVKESLEKNVKVIIVNSKDVDTKEGKLIVSEVKKLLDSKGIYLIGLGSAGIYFENLNLLSGKTIPIKGGLSFLTQSDNLIESLVDLWNDDNVGVESVLGLGSKEGISENTLLEFYNSHNEYLPKIICMYLENLSTPEITLKSLEEITKKIPVVMMFPILNPITRKKVLKHTSSVLQNYDYLKLALEKVGVNLVGSITELTSLTMLYKNIGKEFYANWLPFVLTNSFFLTLEAHSMLYKNRIPVLEPSGELKDKLNEFYAKEIKTEVDYLGMIDKLFKEQDLDTVFLSLTKDESIDLEILAEGIERLEHDYNKVVIVTVLEVNHKVNPHKVFNSRSIANYKYLENAIYAYTEIRKRAEYLNLSKAIKNTEKDEIFTKVDFEKKGEVLSMINELKKQASKSVSFAFSKKLLKNYSFSFIDDYNSEDILKEHHEYIVNIKCELDTYENTSVSNSIGYKMDINLIYHENKEFVNLTYSDLIPLNEEKLEVLIYEQFGKVFVDDRKMSVLIGEVKRISKSVTQLINDYPSYFEKVELTLVSNSKLNFVVEESEIDIVI